MSWVKLSTTFLSRNSFGYFYMVGRMSVWPCVWVPQNAVRAHFYPNFEYSIFGAIKIGALCLSNVGILQISHTSLFSIRLFSISLKSSFIRRRSSVIYCRSVKWTTFVPISRSNCALTRGKLKLQPRTQETKGYARYFRFQWIQWMQRIEKHIISFNFNDARHNREPAMAMSNRKLTTGWQIEWK